MIGKANKKSFLILNLLNSSFLVWLLISFFPFIPSNLINFNEIKNKTKGARMYALIAPMIPKPKPTRVKAKIILKNMM